MKAITVDHLTKTYSVDLDVLKELLLKSKEAKSLLYLEKMVLESQH